MLTCTPLQRRVVALLSNTTVWTAMALVLVRVGLAFSLLRE